MCQFALVVLAWHPYGEIRLDNAMDFSELEPYLWSGLEEGLKSALTHPLRVVLVDAQFHEVDSSPTSFRIVGRKAAKEVQDRLQALEGPPEERTATEIRVYWEQSQASYLPPVREALDRHLSWDETTESWSQSCSPVGKVVRLRGDAPRIWTTIDLDLGLYSPELNELLGVGPWQQNPDRFPWEFGKARLSKLSGTSPWKLKPGVEAIIEKRWLDSGRPYLDQFQRTADLVSVGGYLDPSQRAGLHFLVGDEASARAVLEADTRTWPGATYKARRDRVMAALKGG